MSSFYAATRSCFGRIALECNCTQPAAILQFDDNSHVEPLDNISHVQPCPLLGPALLSWSSAVMVVMVMVRIYGWKSNTTTQLYISCVSQCRVAHVWFHARPCMFSLNPSSLPFFHPLHYFLPHLFIWGRVQKGSAGEGCSALSVSVQPCILKLH